MIIDIMLVAIAITALIIGTITDIKIREVPDWLNYSLVFIGLGLRLIYSSITLNWAYFFYGIAGFAVFLALALAMFYAGQWGGGDSKLLIGLGALIGLKFELNSLFASFLINILLTGALYGLAYSVVLACKNRRKFMEKTRELLNKKQHIAAKKILLAAALILLAAAIFIKEPLLKFPILLLALMALLIFYLWIFIKAVEDSCMLRYIRPEQLTEGDWIAKDVIINKKRITGPKDLGIERKQIKQLISFYKKGKVKKILVKYGIPFVPSFLMAFVISLVYGNLIFLFLR